MGAQQNTRTLVLAFDVTGWSDEQVQALMVEASVQGEASEGHPDVEGTAYAVVPVHVTDNAELEGILHVGAGL